MARFLREDCRTLRDSLQLEMVAAQYLIQIRDVRTPEGVPVGDATLAGVVAELERTGDRLSHAILRAFAYLGTAQAHDWSADAVARLVERGVALPHKFRDVAEARAVGAWRDARGAFEGEFVFFAEYEHAGGIRHSLGLFVEPSGGGTIKHVGLMSPLTEFEPEDPFHPDALEPLDMPTAGALLEELLDRTYGRARDLVDDYRVVIAAARARAMTGRQLSRSASS